MPRYFGPCGETVVNIETGVAGAVPALAPDLTWPSSKFAGPTAFTRITGIDGTSGGLVTVLSLTGRYAIGFLYLSSLVNESITLKLTVDGDVIWNDTFTLNSAVFLAIGGQYTSSAYGSDVIAGCSSTFLLEITTITAAAITCEYTARPIL